MTRVIREKWTAEHIKEVAKGKKRQGKEAGDRRQTNWAKNDSEAGWRKVQKSYKRWNLTDS